MSDKRQIAILGAGSWGTALAVLLARNGVSVRLWCLPHQLDRLQQDRSNQTYLADIHFPDNLQVTANLSDAIFEVSDVLIVVPSKAFAEVLGQLDHQLPDAVDISWATKGLEPQTGRLLSEVAETLLPNRSYAVISGPTFAMEVGKGLPTALSIAATSTQHAERLADWMHSDCFRAYTSDDLIGLQIGGCAKNVMAIGAGASDTLGFGANTRAALITRGMAEIIRFGVAQGGRPETMMGLGGLGDLVLTCTDNQSRNRRMGEALAKGKTIEQAKADIGQEVEGVGTAKEIYHKALQLGVDMPITEQIYRVLYEGLNPKEAVASLFERSRRSEHE